jgi:hypothetical protein
MKIMVHDMAIWWFFIDGEYKVVLHQLCIVYDSYTKKWHMDHKAW